MRIESILVPVDFSEQTSAAVQHAVNLGNRFNARLLLVHVIPPLPSEYADFWAQADLGGDFPATDQVGAYCTERLKELAADLAANQEIETMVATGEPATEIKRISEERNADLVVMPTHSHGTYRKFIMGSNTAKVLHDVRCPVMTGAHVKEPSGPSNYDNVACCLALDERSELVLRWAAEFAQVWDARLSVIHAIPDFQLENSAHVDFPEVLSESARRQVERLLHTLSAKAEVFIEKGKVRRVVRRLAKQNRVDLLVIGRSSEETAAGRLPSPGYALIRAAPCPVVSL